MSFDVWAHVVLLAKSAQALLSYKNCQESPKAGQERIILAGGGGTGSLRRLLRFL